MTAAQMEIATNRNQYGIVAAGFEGLTDDDFRRILAKLSECPRNERRPRKCKRYEGVLKIVATLPRTVWKLNVVGNQIGDAGMQHLHLIPDTITDLDLSDCGLTPIGIKALCEFLKTNHSITRMIMWGNRIGDEGAVHVGDMMKVNQTIKELCINGCEISAKGCLHLSDGLAENSVLRKFSIGNEDILTDQHVENLCGGLAVNRGLEYLGLCSPMGRITEKSVVRLEKIVRTNSYLKRVGISQNFHDGDFIYTGPGTVYDKLKYWLDLNKCNRKLIHDPESTREQWIDAIIQGAENGNLDAIFLFLINKPDICKLR